jgi:hypothetical protein
MADQPQTADDVKAFVEDRNIRFVRLWFTDILGQLKSFSVNAQELDDAFEGGMGFDGSSITGFNAIEESDMIAMPDASTAVAAARLYAHRHTIRYRLGRVQELTGLDVELQADRERLTLGLRAWRMYGNRWRDEGR